MAFSFEAPLHALVDLMMALGLESSHIPQRLESEVSGITQALGRYFSAIALRPVLVVLVGIPKHDWEEFDDGSLVYTFYICSRAMPLGRLQVYSGCPDATPSNLDALSRVKNWLGCSDVPSAWYYLFTERIDFYGDVFRYEDIVTRRS